MRIDREDDTPVYKQISEALRLKILAEEFKPGERLPSLRELAKQLNVSLLTVQQAVTELVHQDLVVSHHGKGNFISASPRRPPRKSLVGMIGGHVSNPYNASIMEKCREILEGRGYGFLPVLSLQTRADAARAIRHLIDEGVAGAFVLPIESFWEEQLLWDFRRERIPFVYLGSKLDLYYSDYVIDEYEHGIHIAVDFLASLGHTRIACVTAQPLTSPVKKKVAIFRHCIGEKGFQLPEHWCQIGEAEHHEGGYLAAKALLAHGDLPTAILATNDLIAMGVYRALGEAGLRIPGDISIIGSGDFNNSHFYSPPLTTLRIDVGRMCGIGVDVLLRRIAGQGPEEFEQIALRPTLAVRASTSEIAVRREEISSLAAPGGA